MEEQEDAKVPVTVGMKEQSSVEDREGKGSQTTIYTNLESVVLRKLVKFTLLRNISGAYVITRK